MYKYAQIARPLNKLISGENAKKKHKKIEWGNEQEQAFQQLNNLTSALNPSVSLC